VTVINVICGTERAQAMKFVLMTRMSNQNMVPMHKLNVEGVGLISGLDVNEYISNI
jgi:hypothetical protein